MKINDLLDDSIEVRVCEYDGKLVVELIARAELGTDGATAVRLLFNMDQARRLEDAIGAKRWQIEHEQRADPR